MTKASDSLGVSLFRKNLSPSNSFFWASSRFCSFSRASIFSVSSWRKEITIIMFLLFPMHSLPGHHVFNYNLFLHLMSGAGYRPCSEIKKQRNEKQKWILNFAQCVVYTVQIQPPCPSSFTRQCSFLTELFGRIFEKWWHVYVNQRKTVCMHVSLQSGSVMRLSACV